MRSIAAQSRGEQCLSVPYFPVLVSPAPGVEDSRAGYRMGAESGFGRVRGRGI